MKHLIKRKDLGYAVTEGWRCEVSINRSPNGSKASLDDEVYIAQNGYAIFAKGKITEAKPITILKGLSDFVRFSQKTTEVKDDRFWLSKIKEYAKKEEPFTVYVFEYYLGELEQFDFCVPLTERFLKQSAWYYLEDNFQLEEQAEINYLTKHIPSKIRSEIYHKYKIGSDRHIIDIDHLVPRSLGGPGNIIENLIPIAASINRRKSNHVPSKLYDLGKKFNIKIPHYIKIEHDKFYDSHQELSLAKKIIDQINMQPIDLIKADYLTIKNFHFPNS
jgi:hypothetical protein